MYQIRLLTTGDAGHSQPFFYHFLIILIGCFPASAYIFQSLKEDNYGNSHQKIFKVMMIVLMCVVLLVFSLVKTKIVHYSSLAYFPITFLAAYSAYHILYRQAVFRKYTKWLLLGIGGLLAVAITAFPILLKAISENPQKYVEMFNITDIYTAEVLSAEVHWSGMEFFIGIFLFVGLALFIFFILKNQVLYAIVSLYVGSIAVLMCFMPIIAPQIEKYTQNSAIEFFKTLQDEDVYIEVLGYKSYAHYFYSKKTPENSAYNLGYSRRDFREYLLYGDIDKTAYFSTWNKRLHRYDTIPGFEVLYEKNGFVFARRRGINK